jgi:hypothetical protein
MSQLASDTITLAPSAVRAPSSATRQSVFEFLLVGGATFVVFPLAWLVRKLVGLDAADLAFGFTTFYAAYVVNDPHFTVT